MSNKIPKLTQADKDVYKFLSTRNSMKPSDIAKLMGKQKSNISRSLKKLRLNGRVEDYRASDRRETFYVAKEIRWNN